MSLVETFFGSSATVVFAADVNNPVSIAVGSAVRQLYAGFNGGYFWGSSLLIRPYTSIGAAPLCVDKWNDSGLWKGGYGSNCDDLTFFAEDAFGVQYGFRGKAVVQFDPETARETSVADSLELWCNAVCGNPEYYTGYPVLADWERRNHSLATGSRLQPKHLIALGGAFEADNMISKPDIECMRIRCQFWTMTKDVPDGQAIVFRVVD